MPDLSRTEDTPLGKRLPLRILLVEDEAVNRRVTLRRLERMGYRADTASDGAEAVEAARAKAYDLILMDLQMPEMDGGTAVRRIRELPARGTRPRIVALTGDEPDDVRAACEAAGMDDVLGKPVSPAELRAAILRAAPGYRGTSRAAPS
jgi:CheY-like chemotaxis protein